QENYSEIKGITVGTHYLKVLGSDGSKLYGNIITIVQDEVTTILVEGTATTGKTQQNVPVQAVEKPAAGVAGTTGNTGTLNIFSEFTGTVVYLNENRQGEDLKQINGVPAGNHYLKVLKDGVSIFAELVTVKEGQTTTVLVKNDGQVAEKILSSKVNEINEYKNKKLEVLLSTGSQTTTQGASTLFPGYYSYWGYSNSVSTTVGTTDWKIIQGGVKEISERSYASIVGDQPLMQKIDLSIQKETKTSTIAALIALPCIIVATCVLTDAIGDKPWMHKDNPVHPKWETPAAAVSITVGTIAYLVAMKKPYAGHYTTVENAARGAQEYNKKLKSKLGLPEDYDVK
ncbi:MAG TPA: PEGA domain-containing protein, partial [Bacteroidales bacterium]|nr:PEGA domain-containing protein [Bacteroidales bacterium]